MWYVLLGLIDFVTASFNHFDSLEWTVFAFKNYFNVNNSKKVNNSVEFVIVLQQNFEYKNLVFTDLITLSLLKFKENSKLQNKDKRRVRS